MEGWRESEQASERESARYLALGRARLSPRVGRWLIVLWFHIISSIDGGKRCTRESFLSVSVM